MVGQGVLRECRFGACFFRLGVTCAGTTEEAYRRITYEIPMAAARALAPINPGMTFIDVSGMGAHSSEHGRIMWARVISLLLFPPRALNEAPRPNPRSKAWTSTRFDAGRRGHHHLGHPIDRSRLAGRPERRHRIPVGRN